MEIYVIQTKRFLKEKEVDCEIDRLAHKSLKDAEKQVALLKDIDEEIEDEFKFNIRNEYEILEIKLI